MLPFVGSPIVAKQYFLVSACIPPLSSFITHRHPEMI